jgi:hypothetical protein
VLFPVMKAEVRGRFPAKAFGGHKAKPSGMRVWRSVSDASGKFFRPEVNSIDPPRQWNVLPGKLSAAEAPGVTSAAGLKSSKSMDQTPASSRETARPRPR